MTKDEFISGVVFQRQGIPFRKFVYVPGNAGFDGSNPGHINEVIPSYLGCNYFHACVKWIKEDKIEVYCSIMGGNTLYSTQRFDEFEVVPAEEKNNS
jgi:hypothetical protein